MLFYLSGFYDDDETMMTCAGPVVAMMMLMQWDGAAPARVLLQIDVICDKYLNTCRRLVTGDGNRDCGHTSLAASFVVVLVDCYVQAELVAFLCERRHFSIRVVLFCFLPPLTLFGF